MWKKTSFRVNGSSANWQPFDTEMSKRVDTINNVYATDRLEVAEYKDEVTKIKKRAEGVVVDGKVTACKT